MDQNIEVSIISPVFNESENIETFVSRVFQAMRESERSWELIIVDDGSTDDTMEIAQSWIVKDIRFKYFYKKNGGVSSARNYGIGLAKGEFLQFLDSDDILDLKKIEYSIHELNKSNNKKLQIVVSNFILSISKSAVFL